jgi:glycosyltransferase involved in cell wall biosynthesis
MNILLINHYAGSNSLGMEYRPYYLSREWIKMGHNVTIVSASFAHIRTKQPFVRKDLEESMHEGIKYLWVKTPAYKGNGIKRTINMFTFVVKLQLFAKKISKRYKPDLVIASSTYPADNYPAKKIAKLSSAKYIYEVHDLWPLSPVELGGMSRKHPFIRLMQHAEDFAYKHVDKCVSLLPKTKEYMQEHGLDPKKWLYIPNGISLDEWNDTEEVPNKTIEKINNIRSDSDKIIAYTGSIGVANALQNFINAAELLRDRDIAFIIVGKGPEKDKLENTTKEKGISNVHFLDPVPKRSIPVLLNMFDILYIGLQKQTLFRFGISPNKLIDYMMSGKAVIQAIDAGNNMVQEANCGISVPPENPESLVEAIIRLSSMDKKELSQLGSNGKDYVLKNHLYSRLAKEFIEAIYKGE